MVTKYQNIALHQLILFVLLLLLSKNIYMLSSPSDFRFLKQSFQFIISYQRREFTQPGSLSPCFKQ